MRSESRLRGHFLSRRYGCLSETVGYESAGSATGKPRRGSPDVGFERKVFFEATEITEDRRISELQL